MIAYRTNYGGAPALPILRRPSAPYRHCAETRANPADTARYRVPVHLGLIRQIEVTTARLGMSEARFGRLALRDPCLVSDLRRGRELRGKTEERVRIFLSILDEGEE